jgi:uncharacterized protein
MESSEELPCPICRKPVAIPDPSGTAGHSSLFPFCSDRCKLIDLGRWLDGKYQIPAVDTESDQDEIES